MKILVFCPNWIGDAVMATPTLRALRKRFASAHITGLMQTSIAETLAGSPWFNDVILYNRKLSDPSQWTWPTIRKIRREKFQTGVLLTNSIRSALLAYLGGIKQRVGYAREGRRFLLNDSLPIQKTRRGYAPSPIIDYYLSIAYHLGAAPETYRMELFTNSADEHAANLLWNKFGFAPTDRVVAFNPGSAFGIAKRWPSRKFSELARRLVDEQKVKVLVLCGPSERGLAQFIADASHRSRFVRSMHEEQVSIGLSKAIIRKCAGLVTTDSGPRHFGAAFGIPVVSLFGPTHIKWTDTYFELEAKLQKKLPCGPCQQRVCPLGHLQCMEDLTIDLVNDETVRLLSQVKQQKAVA